MQNQKMFLSNANRDKIFTMRDGTCSICLDEFANRSVIDTCNHEFCFSCIGRWSEVNATCPVCREDFHAIVHDIGGCAFTLRSLRTNGTVRRVDMASIDADMADFREKNESNLEKICLLLWMFQGIVGDSLKSKAVVERYDADLRRRSEPCASMPDAKSFDRIAGLVESNYWFSKLAKEQILLEEKLKVFDYEIKSRLLYVNASDTLCEKQSDSSVWTWLKKKELEYLGNIVDVINAHKNFCEIYSNYYQELLASSEREYSAIYSILKSEKENVQNVLYRLKKND